MRAVALLLMLWVCSAASALDYNLGYTYTPAQQPTSLPASQANTSFPVGVPRYTSTPAAPASPQSYRAYDPNTGQWGTVTNGLWAADRQVTQRAVYQYPTYSAPTYSAPSYYAAPSYSGGTTVCGPNGCYQVRW